MILKIVKYLLWCIMGVIPRDGYVELTKKETAIGSGIIICGGILWFIITIILYDNTELDDVKQETYAFLITILIALILCGLLIVFEPFIEPYILPYISNFIYS